MEMGTISVVLGMLLVFGSLHASKVEDDNLVFAACRLTLSLLALLLFASNTEFVNPTKFANINPQSSFVLWYTGFLLCSLFFIMNRIAQLSKEKKTDPQSSTPPVENFPKGDPKPFN
jgi:hypothetical protein